MTAFEDLGGLKVAAPSPFRGLQSWLMRKAVCGLFPVRRL
jgi:hypothetical protein